MPWIAPPAVGERYAGASGTCQLARMVLLADVTVDAWRLEVTTGAVGATAQLVVMVDDGGHPGGLFLSSQPEAVDEAQMSEVLMAAQFIPAGPWWVGLAERGAAVYRARDSRLLPEVEVMGTASVGRQFPLGASLPSTAPAVTTCDAVPRVHLRMA